MFIKYLLGHSSQDVEFIHILQLGLQSLHIPESGYYFSGQEDEQIMPFKTLGVVQLSHTLLIIPSLQVLQLTSHFSHNSVFVFLKEPVSHDLHSIGLSHVKHEISQSLHFLSSIYYFYSQLSLHYNDFNNT